MSMKTVIAQPDPSLNPPPKSAMDIGIRTQTSAKINFALAKKMGSGTECQTPLLHPPLINQRFNFANAAAILPAASGTFSLRP